MTQLQNHRENFSHSDELNPRKLLANQGDVTIWVVKDDVSASVRSIMLHLKTYFEILRPEDEKNIEKFNNAGREIFGKIFSIIEQNGWNIVSANIDVNGIFHIQFENGEKKTLNIIEEWKQLTVSEQEQEIQQTARKEGEKLQDEVAKEAFFGGSVVAEYISAGSLVVGSVGVIMLGGLTSGIIDLKKNGLHAVQSIVIVDETGQKRRITFKKPYVGTKAEIAQSMEKILEASGYVLDTSRKKIFSKTFVAVNSSRDRLNRMTYQDYQNSNEWKKRPLTPEQFDQSKEFFLKETDGMSKKLQNGTLSAANVRTNIWKIGATSLGVLGSSLFFYDFKQQQTPSNFLWAFAEEGGAIVGAKLGTMVPVLPMLKPITAVSGGVLGAYGANFVKNQVEPIRKKWQWFQDSNYSDGRNYFGEALMMFMPEGWDFLNNNVFDKTRDLGINRMEFSVLGKRLEVLPEINIIQRSVNLGTNPAEWMAQSMNRNISDWNKEVDNYKTRLTEQVYEELWKYFHDRGVYGDKKAVSEAGGKKQLFQQEMHEILLGGNSGVVFDREIKRLLSFLWDQLDNLTADKIPNTDINNEIFYRAEAMKIDSFFVKNQLDYYNNKIYHMTEFSSQMKLLHPHVSDSTRRYLDVLFMRMQDNKPLFENENEKLMYESVINNDNKISIKGMEISVGNYFAMVLETMAQHKMHHEFMTNINNGDTDGISRHWIPHAFRSKS